MKFWRFACGKLLGLQRAVFRLEADFEFQNDSYMVFDQYRAWLRKAGQFFK